MRDDIALGRNPMTEKLSLFNVEKRVRTLEAELNAARKQITLVKSTLNCLCIGFIMLVVYMAIAKK
jgi:hypothetical protein